MSDTISRASVMQHLQTINQQFGIALNPEDFRNAEYSVSSIRDILIQKVIDELTGEWTSDMAFHKIKNATIKVTGITADKLTMDSSLNEVFPADKRKEQIAALSAELGIPLEILKPNSALYGTLIFLFFACIPFAIGMDWFVSGIAMIVIAIILYIMGKTGNHFRMKTLGQMADVIAWKNYLQQKKSDNTVSESEIRTKIEAIVS